MRTIENPEKSSSSRTSTFLLTCIPGTSMVTSKYERPVPPPGLSLFILLLLWLLPSSLSIFFNPRRASSQQNKPLERKISREVWLRSGGTVSERNGDLTCRRLKWTNYIHTVTKWAQKKKKWTERMTRRFLPPSREERRCVNVSFAHTSTATCCS